MKRVIIESPYAGDVEYNTRYARMCLLDSVLRGEAPLASHLLYTQILDDLVAADREKGLSAGWAWIERCDLVAVYTDLGTSPGMMRGIERAIRAEKEIEYRSLPAHLFDLVEVEDLPDSILYDSTR